MAVVTVYGMTQSGKSKFVNDKFITDKNRVVIVDFMNCFSGNDIFYVNNQSDILKIFKKFQNKSKYKIIIRFNRGANFILMVDFVISLSCALGRLIGPYNPHERVWLVIDEADRVVKSNFQSKRVKHLVNTGRHDNCDSVFIARNPHRLNTDIRVNASEIVVFRLTNALSIADFRNNFGVDNCKKIQNLSKYHCFIWNDTGKSKILNEKGAVVWCQ